MLDASGSHMLCLTLQSSFIIVSFPPGSTVLHLGNVGSDQLDISAMRAGRSVVLLPEQLELTSQREVRSGTVNLAHGEAAIESFGSGRSI